LGRLKTFPTVSTGLFTRPSFAGEHSHAIVPAHFASPDRASLKLVHQEAAAGRGIADDCLRDVYVRGKYRDVILPMTVIRRLDAVLEDTKTQVLAMKKKLDEAKLVNQTEALYKAAKQSFCNCSPFKLRDLTGRSTQQKIKAGFTAYLDGFSPNVQEILKRVYENN
jgi:hypothetical protein